MVSRRWVLQWVFQRRLTLSEQWAIQQEKEFMDKYNSFAAIINAWAKKMMEGQFNYKLWEKADPLWKKADETWKALRKLKP